MRKTAGQIFNCLYSNILHNIADEMTVMQKILNIVK